MATDTTVRKGTKIQVTTSSKGLPPVGTVGQCIWTGTCRFTGNPRMGLKVAGEVYWGPTSCVERTGRAKAAPKAAPAPAPKAAPKPLTAWDHIDYEDDEIEF